MVKWLFCNLASYASVQHAILKTIYDSINDNVKQFFVILSQKKNFSFAKFHKIIILKKEFSE